jgi:hypothetical protein
MTSIPSRNPGLRGLAWAALLLVLAGCATTVAISARFPARYGETTDIRRVAIGGFGGYGGDAFGSALQAELVSATFDGQSYFTVVELSNRDPNIDPGRAAAFGRSMGAQGVILGTVNTQFNTENYQGSESRCVRREGDKCKEYKSFPIPCWRRTVDVVAVPRLVKISTGQIVYSTTKAANRRTAWCAGQSQSVSDLSLVTEATAVLVADIRRDIGPYNAVLSATLKTKADGLPKEMAPQFAAAVKLASNGQVGEACRQWETINTAAPNTMAVVYDLGVCAESVGDYVKALALYRQAQGLAAAGDRDVAASTARAQNLLQANGQLAEDAARRAAAAKAEADRQAAAAKADADRQAAANRAEADRAAAAAKSRQSAAAAAKAAQDAKRRAAITRYGPDAADAILAGKVKIGMTRAQVVAAKGQPSQAKSVGPGEEILSYGATRIVLLNGRVTSIR